MIVRRPKVRRRTRRPRQSHTGGQYSRQYFTCGWIGLRLIGIFFSVTIANVSYSDNAEWMLNEGATYHVCPNRDWFSNFEKLDGCFTVMDDDHPCNMVGYVQFVSRYLME